MIRFLILTRIASEFRSRFYKFAQGDATALHPNLRSIAFSVLLRTSSDPVKDFESVLTIFKETLSADERISALTCLGAIHDNSLVQRLLNQIVLDNNLVRPQDVMYPLAGLAGDNPDPCQVRPLLWIFLKEKWNLLVERYGTSMGLLGHVLQRCLVNSIGPDFIHEVKEWSRGDLLDDKEKKERVDSLKSVQSKLDQALEKVVSNTAWVERSRLELTEWAK